MKKMLLSIIAITMCNVLMAQWNVGFTVGCSSNQYDYDTQWAYRLRYENRWGYTAEIPVSYSVNEWLKITSGIAYVEKGFFVENLTTLNDFLNPNHDSGNEIERRDCHLSVPVSAEFSFGNDRWRGFCCLGGYASYLMASYFEGYSLSQPLYTIQLPRPFGFCILAAIISLYFPPSTSTSVIPYALEPSLLILDSL